MSVKKFKFVSPGVFVDEIDNSQLTDKSEATGPVIIGRTKRGPALRPVRVESFSDFVDLFGSPDAGSAGGDVWRENLQLAPTYASYAAQAWLKNNSPVTMVRLLGAQHSKASSTPGSDGRGGWKTTNLSSATAGGGAYGLFLVNSASLGSPNYVDIRFGQEEGAVEGAAEINFYQNGVELLNETTEVLTATGGGWTAASNQTENLASANALANQINTNATLQLHVSASMISDTDDSSAVVRVYALQSFPGDISTETISARYDDATSTAGVLRMESSAGALLDQSQDGVAGSAAATARLTFADGELTADDQTITLIDSAGLSRTYTIKTDDDAPGNNTEFNAGFANTQGAAAENFAQVVASAAGHNGTILAQDSAGVTFGGAGADFSDGVVSLVQATAGAAGNTTITTSATWNNNTAVNIGAAFEGGGPEALHTLAGGSQTVPSGTLAAVWYLDSGVMGLNGVLRGTGDGHPDHATAATVTGSAVWVKSTGVNKEFKAALTSLDGSTKNYETTFNFNRSSQKFIRNVFNTNPTLTNSDITSGDVQTYWLGETFERAVDEHITNTAAGSVYGCILNLGNGTNDGAYFKYGTQTSKTGWFISQDLRTDPGGEFDPCNIASHARKLFRLESLDTGQWEHMNLKISIQDIKAPTNDFNSYGSFSVVIRKLDDTDNAVKVVERFNGVDLNPNSINYIARRIGDKYVSWDEGQKRYKEYGNYDNNSKFIRVVMDADVDDGTTDPLLLPFGVTGPLRMKGWSYASGSHADHNENTVNSLGAITPGSAENTAAFVQGANGASMVNSYGDQIGNAAASFMACGPGERLPLNPFMSFAADIVYPRVELRSLATDGDLSSPTTAYFGADTTQKGTKTKHDESTLEVLRPMPLNIGTGAQGWDPDATTEYSWIFTLDELKAGSTDSSVAQYVSGSRSAAADSDKSYTAASGSWKEVLDQGYDRFTAVLYGGSDGLNIKERDAFRNSGLEGGSETTNSAFYSVKRAIDSVSDPEVVEMNVGAIPGVWHEGLTTHMMNVCEDRGDSLAIIDLKNDYDSENEGTNSVADRIGTPSSAISSLQQRGINTSYGAAYYPWVQIRDTIGGQLVWVPPSVVALGVLSNTQKRDDLWFAPAGFQRGGLTEGSAGLPVVGVRQKLTSAQRDDLYDANINPIASFPAEGIVIFGQKTLQVTPSALDRINVRRLMIFVKKEISKMASNILFDQNVQSTWNRFTSEVNPFLSNIKSRFGLDDFKVILDETTTTADLVDQNTIYAKIFLKPTKSVEFIALDFAITDTGAAFED